MIKSYFQTMGEYGFNSQKRLKISKCPTKPWNGKNMNVFWLRIAFQATWTYLNKERTKTWKGKLSEVICYNHVNNRVLENNCHAKNIMWTTATIHIVSEQFLNVKKQSRLILIYTLIIQYIKNILSQHSIKLLRYLHVCTKYFWNLFSFL